MLRKKTEKFNILVNQTKQQMTETRWQHTEGVIEVARELATHYGCNVEKAELAALLHDYAKDWPKEKMEKIVHEQNLPQEWFACLPELWHAKLGAWAVQDQLNIYDSEILDAISSHTTGHEQMTLLEKIICLADYIEPSRHFPGVENIRTLAFLDLDKALVAAFDHTIRFLLSREKPIFPDLILARNDLLS